MKVAICNKTLGEQNLSNQAERDLRLRRITKSGTKILHRCSFEVSWGGKKAERWAGAPNKDIMGSRGGCDPGGDTQRLAFKMSQAGRLLSSFIVARCPFVSN